MNVDADVVKNDRTLRDEDWFLEKIEKCRYEELNSKIYTTLFLCNYSANIDNSKNIQSLSSEKDNSENTSTLKPKIFI